MSATRELLAHRLVRVIAVATLVVTGGAAMSSCGEVGAQEGDAPTSSAVDADATIPDVTLPDVTTPAATTVAPAPAPTNDPADDGGMGPFGLITLLLLAGLLGGLAMWLTQRGDDHVSTRGPTARDLDHLVDDSQWAVRQATLAVGAADISRVAGAWPVTRDHFIDIERLAAGIHANDAILTTAADGVGQAVAELRGALDAYVNALGQQSDGHLDALGPLRGDVTTRCANLTTRIQALVSARNPTA